MDFRLKLGRPPRTPWSWRERRMDELLRREAEAEARHHRHDGHRKEQVGRCVYCLDCKERLYQGTL